MQSHYSEKLFWKVIYIIWPPVLRLIEILKLHNSRQKYFLGHLNSGYDKKIITDFLLSQGFEFDVIAYRDPGQILGMRKLDTPLYQYHIRFFDDGEIRGHFEYTPEAKPIKHSLETGIESRIDFFKKMLGEMLV
ncbi:MAG: hypothetical protein WC603_02635 [Candidatus Paceibacterota bacterium]|jgi:hypothetical protein